MNSRRTLIALLLTIAAMVPGSTSSWGAKPPPPASCPQPAPALTAPTTCSAVGVPGCLDTSFGSGGIVRTDTSGPFPVSTDFDLAREVAIQPDGRIVAAGWSRKADNSGNETALVRYYPDGSLDTTFGSGGMARLALDGVNDMALQADGKILLAGFGFSVVRLNSDGTLDTSFGSGGIVSVTFGSKNKNSSSLAQAVAVQGDGKILAAGNLNLVRLNQDGSLDSTFGSGGKVVTAASAYAITLQTVAGGQRILVGGGNGDFAIMRFTMSGAVDTSFGPRQDGRVLKNVCGNDFIRRLGLDAAGNIVAGGMVPIGTDAFGRGNMNPTLARFTANGLPDNAFGDGVAQRPGTALVDVLGGYDTTWGFAIQGDGKILVSGRAESSDGAAAYVYVIRFNPNGTLDTTFGVGGAVAADVRSGSGARDNYGQRLALQTDGKIVVVGSTAANNTYNFVVVRLWP